MDNKKRIAQVISILTLFGVAIGNAMGLLIGIVFIPGNLGIGLLIGNILGCVGGLLLGIIISKIMVREK